MSAPGVEEKWAFGGTRCPFDAIEFKREDQIVLCPDCRTPHHMDCWQAHDGCTQFGCQARGVSPLEALEPLQAELVVLEQQEERKPCEFCGEMILSVARKCKHCGEYLDPLLRRERAKYLIPYKPELPVGASFLSLSQTLAGLFTGLTGLVVLLIEPAIGGLVGMIVGVGLFVMGLGLNSGKEWARRSNEVLLGFSTMGSLTFMLLAFLTGQVESGVGLLIMSLINAGILSSLRSPECRRFCRIES